MSTDYTERAEELAAAHEPMRIYGAADVADALGVTRAAVSNWRRRRADAPAPDYVDGAGVAYWSDLATWRAWYAPILAERAEAAERRAAEAAGRAEDAAALARGRAEVARIVAARAGSA